MKTSLNLLFPRSYWREVLLMSVVAVSLALVFSLPPVAQNPDYHNFVDRREFFNTPNFFDVVSNFAFLFIGVAGLIICFKNYLGSMQNAWIVLCLGVALVSLGSAHYHANPNNQTLVWDRLPMTVGFIGLLIAVLGEYVSRQFGWLIIPALLAGFFSVTYWQWFDDLRFYLWVQALSLLIVPIVMILYRSRYPHQWLLILALVLYGLAKLAELADAKIFELTYRLISGHTIKHLLAAAGCSMIVLMLYKRRSPEK